MTLLGLLVNAISIFCDVLVAALVARAILSWFVGPFSGRSTPPILFKINGIVLWFTEPFIRPVRNLLSRFNTGMFDLSLIVCVVAISFLRNVIIRLLIAIFTFF
ncbi:MAG: YggT family protein [Clostridiales Family XIII bacterium]|nr:YggT family protein [Clostridiales Family XIII bacterium]